MMSEESNLDMLREEIKKITIEIIRLTGKRLLLAKKIGEIKNQRNLPMEDLKVEKELNQVIIEKCQTYNVDRSFGLELLNLLIDEAKRIQIKTLNIKEKTRQTES